MSFRKIDLEDKITKENEEIREKYYNYINDLINKYTSLELINMVNKLYIIKSQKRNDDFDNFIKQIPEGFINLCFINMYKKSYDNLDIIEKNIRNYMKFIEIGDIQMEIFNRNINILKDGIEFLNSSNYFTTKPEILKDKLNMYILKINNYKI